MAVCYPDYGDDERAFKSKAELAFYRACQQSLSREYCVFHSISWIARHGGEARDGEADFVICHPQRGVLIVEVKGGRIRADLTTNKWTSTDSDGTINKIKNPFSQASSNKYKIIEKLKEHRDWPRLGIRRVIAGHAAFFPSVDDGRRLQGPEAPPQIIGDRSDFDRLESWVEGVFDYWADTERAQVLSPLGPAGVQLMRRIFARIVEAKPLLSAQVAGDELELLRLTKNQIQILDILARQRRVSISGGAGTGKTVLAIEKARRLASEGFKTLLTCYNNPLSDHLRQVCSSEQNLDVIGFHRLCKSLVDRASALSGRDFLAEAQTTYPRKDLWDHYYPIALAYALDVLDQRYDAIVVDEGQDFGEEFWLPIEMLLRDEKASPLYIFTDENQNVYARASTFPADAAPITLITNCRNTRKIHLAAYRFYSGVPVSPSSLEGEDVQMLEAPNLERQAKKICELVTRLLTNERMPASSISILIGNRIRRHEYEKALSGFILPNRCSWGGFDDQGDRVITVETVARFKGLESGVVILWGLDGLGDFQLREAAYVGISRAKSVLYLCGSSSLCHSIVVEC